MSRKLVRNTAVLDAAEAERGARAMGQSARGKGPVVVEVPIGRVDLNPDQPRRHFDPVEMDALKASIQEKGLIQPIGVQPQNDGRYLLVFGERRFRAVRDLGHQVIHAVTVEGAADEVAVIENLLRVDLDVFEEADAFGRLLDRHGYSQAALARLVGKSTSEVSRILKVRRLPQIVMDENLEHRVPRVRLYELADIEGEEAQLRAWEALKAGGVPVVIANLDDDQPGAEPRPRKAPAPLQSALPSRFARAIVKADETLEALRSEPKPLADEDRERLQRMRDAIDAILKSEMASAE